MSPYLAVGIAVLIIIICVTLRQKATEEQFNGCPNWGWRGFPTRGGRGITSGAMPVIEDARHCAGFGNGLCCGHFGIPP